VVGKNVLRCVILTFKKIYYLYQKWADHRTFAQPVQNTLPENIVQEDTTIICITALLKSVGRSSGHYTANNPFWFKRNNQFHNFGSATAVDGLDDTFRPTYVPQQAPSEISQYSASPINRSLPTMNDASYRTGLTQNNIVKIQELKRLAYKYPHYCAIPDEAIKFAIYNSIIGDNTLLDQMLEQLRTIDVYQR
jgi:hypothetical protein